MVHGLSRDRGAVTIWSTTLVVLLAVMVALALNVGHVISVRGELRNAADAAALAGVMELDGTEQGQAGAVQVAMEHAALHATDRVAVEVHGDDVELGRWVWGREPEAAFQGIAEIQGQFPGQPDEVTKRVTAVRVRADRAALPVTFGAFLGRDTVGVGAHAVAAGGGPCQVECALPFTIADCNVPAVCGTSLYLRASPAPSDLMAFTILDPSQATPPTVNELLQQILDGQCPTHEVGEWIHVNNGNFFNPIQANFRQLIGSVHWVAITQGYSCPYPQFVQDHEIAGFGRVRLDEIVVAGSDKYLRVTYLCDLQEPGPAGCIYYGTHARPMLVH
jgi:hypothetical protein